MQLRKNISAPDRFDEEILVTKPRSATKPAHPALMASQVVAFDPDNPPAAFPSLPLNSPPRRSDASPRALETVPQAKENGTKAWPRPYRRSAYVWRDLQIISAPVDYGDLGILPTPKQKEARSRDLWVSLPLSLQYHIYKHLSLSKSDWIISRILGLSDKHFKELQAAVALRDESPASVSDIWNSCANSSPVREDSTVIDIMDIDPDIFQQNLDAMAFASKYEVAYESEIMRAKMFLESRNVPITVLGIWVPDCTGSEGSTEFFRHLPEEIAKLVGSNIDTPGLFSGGFPGRGNFRQTQSSLPRTDLNSTTPTNRATRSPPVDASKVQESRPIISGPTPKRGRHALATVTLVTDPLSPPRHAGGTQHHDKSSRIESARMAPQDDTQCLGDERMSGGMRLRNRSSIPGTRDATQYYFDSDWQSHDSSPDESEYTAPKPMLGSATAFQIRNAAFLTLKIKNTDGLAKIFQDQPPTSEKSGSRETTPLRSISRSSPGHRRLVTLKYSPEKFNLMRASRVSLPIRSSKEDFAASNQDISKELSSPPGTNSSYDFQSPFLKRKASFADISAVPMKRGRLALAARFEMVVQSIETEATILPANSNHHGPAGSHEEVVPAQPQQNNSQSRDFDRAPSFSPIPENEHFEGFQGLLKAQTPSGNCG